MTAVEMMPLARVRARDIPTTYVSGAGKDGHSSFPPKGERGFPYSPQSGGRNTGIPPAGDPSVADS